MKTLLLRYVATLAVTTALLAVTGCNTVSTSTTQAIGTPVYPPTNPATVQILHTPPTRPHVRLGEVRAEPASTSTPASDIATALQNAAAKLGADAVVIVYDQTQIVGAVVNGPWWGRSVQGITGRVVIAVAIKYTGP
jgi:hypothetical protein